MLHTTFSTQTKIKSPRKAIKQAFKDSFLVSSSPITYRQSTFKFPPLEGDINVQKCLFNNCTSDQYGGAVCCNGSSVTNLYVSQSSFTSCTTSSDTAGAVYYSNQESGQCTICETCSFQSSSKRSGNSYGQFAWIEVANTVESMNQVNDSSITQSGKESKYPYYSLHLENGKILLPSVNITNNQCFMSTALQCKPYCLNGKVPSSVTCLISYTSIVNNTAAEWGCIKLDIADSSQCIYSCNIINNDQDTTNCGMIYTFAQLFINSSNIIGNNKDKFLFYQKTSSCKIVITNCTFDDDVASNKRYTGGFTIRSTIKTSFTNKMTYNEDNECLNNDIIRPFLKQTKSCMLSCKCKRSMIDPVKCFNYIFLLSMLPSNQKSKRLFETKPY